MKKIILMLSCVLLSLPMIGNSAEIDFGAKFLDLDDASGEPRRFVSTAVIDDASLVRSFSVTFSVTTDNGRVLQNAQLSVDQNRVVSGNRNDQGRIVVTYDPLLDQIKVRYSLNTESRSVGAVASYGIDTNEGQLGNISITSLLP